MIKRRKIFSEMGIEFQLNTEVGKDITMEALLKDYDAVFLGLAHTNPCVVVWKTKRLTVYMMPCLS